MTKLANEMEIQKAIPFLDIKWAVQNDNQDKDSGFIYHCQRIDQVISLALSNDLEVGYAIHRWYNFQCSKRVEQILCEYGAIPYPDEKDHDIDLTIQGVPFDVKLSIIATNYNGKLDLTKRKDKDTYIEWLKSNASCEGRKHTSNRLFVICDNLIEKSNFAQIRGKLKSFMAYFKDNFEKYKENGVCELIYIPNNGGLYYDKNTQ